MNTKIIISLLGLFFALTTFVTFSYAFDKNNLPECCKEKQECCQKEEACCPEAKAHQVMAAECCEEVKACCAKSEKANKSQDQNIQLSDSEGSNLASKERKACC
jgi:hypothetical protein